MTKLSFPAQIGLQQGFISAYVPSETAFDKVSAVTGFSKDFLKQAFITQLEKKLTKIALAPTPKPTASSKPTASPKPVATAKPKPQQTETHSPQSEQPAKQEGTGAHPLTALALGGGAAMLAPTLMQSIRHALMPYPQRINPYEDMSLRAGAANREQDVGIGMVQERGQSDLHLELRGRGPA